MACIAGLVSSDTKEAISSGVPLMIIFIPALTSFRGGCRGACGVTYGIIINP